MIKRFITIRGREYRVEVNWNAFEDFSRMKGMTISDALKLSLQEGDGIKVMMTAAIREGERLEGRTFDLDPVGLGELISVKNVTDFIAVYKEQYLGGIGDDQPAGGASDDGKKKESTDIAS